METKELDDEALVERAQSAVTGDTRAFEQLVERHQSRVAANCRYITGSESDVPDLAQEVFVKAYFGLSGFDGRSKFRTWLHRIKVNHCINFINRRKGRDHSSVDEPEAVAAEALHVEPRAERETDLLDERQRIATVLDAMGETLRVPLLLRDLDGFSYQEVADALGIGLSAAKMRIKRGREEFRELYARLEREETASAGSGAGPENA